MNRVVTLLISLSIYVFSISSYAVENVFYLLHTKPSQVQDLKPTLQKIKENYHLIQILIPQAYRINQDGEVLGWINDEVLMLGKNYSIKIMPMITNAGYDAERVHHFLSSLSAQKKALYRLSELAHKNHFYGYQFDFEGVSIKDREKLSNFFVRAANQLHAEHLKVSFAVIPAFKNEINASIFLLKFYKHWAGAYDLKILGRVGDFVTVMAYNQHPDGTIPGPNASLGFVEAAIKNILQQVPADKISLGLPTYSLYWFSGHSQVALQQAEISFEDAIHVIKANHASVSWNKQDKINYSIYEKHWLNEYVYLEDVQSFNAKLSLVSKYHLRGISVFRIGTEDERIWSLLKYNQITHSYA